jgi:galactosylceramidase
MTGLKLLIYTALLSMAKSAYVVDDSNGLGLRWEGIGAISGGGATSKLLRDYDPKVASDILDFLFLPNFGLSLQILKVEIGSDTDATEGAEPSHMHSKTDPGNYERGYEWWLMKEAKKRNPDIKLYGLPWGFPGWLNPKATPDSPGGDPSGAFTDPVLTANYTLQWLLGAKREHDLDIDYIGQWNERDAPKAYADRLRQVVKASGLKTTCLDRLPHYPGSGDTPDDQNCTQYAWNTTDGSRWADEEGSIQDGVSARCLARVLNRNYITDCHSATFQWHLVSSFYSYLPYKRCGLAVANEPWSGYYEVISALWAVAHTSQFNPIGWRYAQHSKGVQFLEGGGSIVTRISPDKKDFTVSCIHCETLHDAHAAVHCILHAAFCMLGRVGYIMHTLQHTSITQSHRALDVLPHTHLQLLAPAKHTS